LPNWPIFPLAECWAMCGFHAGLADHSGSRAPTGA